LARAKEIAGKLNKYIESGFQTACQSKKKLFQYGVNEPT
jgi:hypothetical protein